MPQKLHRTDALHRIVYEKFNYHLPSSDDPCLKKQLFCIQECLFELYVQGVNKKLEMPL